MLEDTQTRTHTQMNRRTNTHTHTHRHTHTHTQTDAHAHTQTHTQRFTDTQSGIETLVAAQASNKIMVLLYMPRPYGRGNLLQKLNLQSFDSFDGLSKTKTRSCNSKSLCDHHISEISNVKGINSFSGREMRGGADWMHPRWTHANHQTLAATQA